MSLACLGQSKISEVLHASLMPFFNLISLFSTLTISPPLLNFAAGARCAGGLPHSEHESGDLMLCCKQLHTLQKLHSPQKIHSGAASAGRDLKFCRKSSLLLQTLLDELPLMRVHKSFIGFQMRVSESIVVFFSSQVVLEVMQTTKLTKANIK